MKTIIPTLLLICISLNVFSFNNRIAIVADGNNKDSDDVVGTPLSIAILRIFDNEDNLVHYSHSCDLSQSEAGREEQMHISLYETAKIWGGFDMGNFFNARSSQSATIEHLKQAINASASDDILWIVEAGEPDIIYHAMSQSNESARQYVKIVTHHPNNDVGTDYDLSDIEALPGTPSDMVVRISDQNENLKVPFEDFHWLRDHRDYRANWIYERGEVAEEIGPSYIKGYFDPSDAGMIWYLLTGATEGGDQFGTSSEIEDQMNTWLINNPYTLSYVGSHGNIPLGQAAEVQVYYTASEAVDIHIELMENSSSPVIAYETLTSIRGSYQKTALVSVPADLSTGEYIWRAWMTPKGAGYDQALEVIEAPVTVTPAISHCDVPRETERYLIIEAENSVLAEGWETGSDYTGATGDGYIVFEGSNSFSSVPEDTKITYTFQISNPGTYQFKWRSRNGSGAIEADEENDSWLNIEADDFYGILHSKQVHLGDEYAKVWIQNMSAWSYECRGEHSDDNGFDMYAVFNNPGEYQLTIAGRSHGHPIDRMVLYQSSQESVATNSGTPATEGSCDTVHVTGIDLDSDSITIQEGQQERIIPIISPSHSTDKSVTWSSDNDTIASISSNGLVTAINEGSTMIRLVTNDGGFIDSIKVNITPYTGEPPIVTFYEPSNNQSFSLPANIYVSVGASDIDDTVAYVQLYINNQLIGQKDSYPYEWNTADNEESQLRNLALGEYTLTASATDTRGNVTESNISFVVGGPVVTFTQPSHGDSLTAPASIYVIAEATSSFGEISNIQLFLDNELVRQENYPPFEWNGVGQNDPGLRSLPIGNYTLKALATDENGYQGDTTITIHVKAAPDNPTNPTENIINNNDNYEVIVYPNPFKDNVNLILPYNNEYLTIEIWNTNGELIYSDGIVNTEHVMINKTDIKYMKSGIYLLKLIGEKKVQTIKILNYK